MKQVFIVMVREREDNNPDNVGVDMVFYKENEAQDYCDTMNALFGENSHWVVKSSIRGYP